MEDSEVRNLEIAVDNTEKDVIIKIKDTGCGVSDENIKKLFTPFFTTKKMGKGTGLGLAITYGIIKMHRGDIRVKSTLKEGTEFTIKLPLKVTKLNNFE